MAFTQIYDNAAGCERRLQATLLAMGRGLPTDLVIVRRLAELAGEVQHPRERGVSFRRGADEVAITSERIGVHRFAAQHVGQVFQPADPAADLHERGEVADLQPLGDRKDELARQL